MKSNRIENLIFLTSSLFLLAINEIPFVKSLQYLFYPFSRYEPQSYAGKYTYFVLGIFSILAFIYFFLTYFRSSKRSFDLFLYTFKNCLLYMPIIVLLLVIPVDPHFAKFTYLSYILLIVFIALLVFDTLNFLFDFKYPKLSFLVNLFKQIILLLLVIYVFSLIAIDYLELEENEKRYIPNFAITCTTASFYFASFLAYLGFSLYKFTNLDQLANEVIVKWKKYTLHPYIWFYYQFIHF